MTRPRQYNPTYNRYFRCKLGSCGGVCTYNLQEMSQNNFVITKCQKCKKEWRIEESKHRKSCCGRMVVRVSSVEKNAQAKPIVFNESVHTG